MVCTQGQAEGEAAAKCSVHRESRARQVDGGSVVLGAQRVEGGEAVGIEDACMSTGQSPEGPLA